MMKQKLILIIIISVFTLFVRISNAQSFLTQDKIWSDYYHSDYYNMYDDTGKFLGWTTAKVTTLYKVGADSLIEGKLYKQILNSRDSLMEKWSLAAPMREEGNKVFQYDSYYKPCLDGEMIRWSCLDRRDCDGGVTSQDIIAYGDTLFNGILYKKLFRDFSFDSQKAEESNMNWINHVSSFNWIWDGYFIRESEDASKLYIYHPYYGEEFLISDLDLQEGDSVLLFTDFLGMCETFVDSIYYVNDLKHIALHFFTFNHSKETVTFIESVGNDRWFIYPPNCNPSYVCLNCFLNQTTFYKNTKSSDFWYYDMLPCGCSLSGSKINSISEDNYNIFIDKNKIEIVFDIEIDIDITIYNMEGKIYYSGKNLSDKKIIIPLLSKGIYILNVFDIKNNQSITKKFIMP